MTATTRVLAARISALILVVGENGMGKSTFLHEVGRHAREEGWSVADADGEGELAVAPATTPVMFDRRVRALLQLSERKGGLPLQGATSTTAMSSDAASRAVRSLGDESLPLALVGDIRATERPTLLLVDGYTPSDAFAGWFIDQFAPTCKKATLPIIIVVAMRPTAMSGFEPVVDTTFTFAPIDEEPIRSYFAMLSAKVHPPITPDELARYIAETRERPDLLTPLTRMLLLTTQDSP